MSAPGPYLITGGAGFIGSHLAERLVLEGREVRVIDDLSTGSVDNVAHLMRSPNFRFEKGTVADDAAMDRLASGVFAIVHLAAAVGVRLILERAIQTLETNVLGSDAVLRAAHRHGCRVVVASTSEVYGKSDKIPLNEEHDVVLGASSKSRWGYAAGKLFDEFLALAYHREHGVPTVIVRLFNVAGPRQTGRYGMVLPRLVGQALRDEPLTVYDCGDQTRCFCDVRDVVPALVRLAEHPAAAGRVYNVGSTEEVRIRDLAERVKRATGSAAPIVYVPYAEAYGVGFEDVPRRVPDIARVRASIGWRPHRSLDETLASVVAFERARLRDDASAVS